MLIAFFISLTLVPALVSAESFTLPSKAVFLQSWEYWAACANPVDCWGHNYGVAFSPDAFLVYRVLISPDGSERVLDYASQSDDVHNYYPVYYHSLSAHVSELPLELTEPGDYRVELRKIQVPSPTAWHSNGFTPDSTVEWWVAVGLDRNPVPGADCRGEWGDRCWLIQNTGETVKLSDKSVLLEYYEITVAGLPVTLPDIGRSSGMVLVNAPFSDNKGVAQTDNDKAMAGMAVAGILAIGATGAGAYIYRSYSTQSGSSFKAYQTAAGKANDAAVLAEKEKIRKMDEAYEEKMRQYNLKKQLDAQAAALSVAQADAQSRQDQLAADLAKIQNSKNYAEAGSSYALLAAKYGDILTDDGRKQLMDASNQAWSANTTATAVFSPMVLAATPEPPKSKTQELVDGYQDNWWVQNVGGAWNWLNEKAEEGAAFGRSLGDTKGVGVSIRVVSGGIKFVAGTGQLITVDVPYGVYSVATLTADSIQHPENNQKNHDESQAVLRNYFVGGIGGLVQDFQRDPAMAIGEITPMILGPKALKGEAPIVETSKGTFETTPHAFDRMRVRGISAKDMKTVIENGETFQYFHDGVWKTGYYDPVTGTFVSTLNGKTLTVINDVTPNYINNLKAVQP